MAIEYKELEAVKTIKDAALSLENAIKLAEQVGYGQEVLRPLTQAKQDVEYALGLVQDGRS